MGKSYIREDARRPERTLNRSGLWVHKLGTSEIRPVPTFKPKPSNWNRDELATGTRLPVTRGGHVGGHEGFTATSEYIKAMSHSRIGPGTTTRAQTCHQFSGIHNLPKERIESSRPIIGMTSHVMVHDTEGRLMHSGRLEGGKIIHTNVRSNVVLQTRASTFERVYGKRHVVTYVGAKT